MISVIRGFSDVAVSFWLRSAARFSSDRYRSLWAGTPEPRRDYAETTAGQVAIERDKVGAKRVAAISRKPSGVGRPDGYKRLHNKLGARVFTWRTRVRINYSCVSPPPPPENDSVTGVLHHSYTPRYCRSRRVNSVQPNALAQYDRTTRPPNIGHGRSVGIFAQ